jgi:hypothetical protein
MPNPRNRLQWNATCKVYPAISDLQAVESIVQHMASGVAGGAAFDIDCAQVPANKIWVITAVIDYIDGGAVRNHWQYIREGAANKTIINYGYNLAQQVPLVTYHTVFLTAGQFIRFSFSFSAGAGTYHISYTGYQVALY